MEETWPLTHCLTGYIDLSKRRVSPEDVVKCEERYNKSKAVHSIMRHVAEATQTPLETLYQKIAWPLDRKFGHSHDAFKLAITYVIWQGYCFKDVSDMSPAATPMSGTTSSSPPNP